MLAYYTLVVCLWVCVCVSFSFFAQLVFVLVIPYKCIAIGLIQFFVILSIQFLYSVCRVLYSIRLLKIYVCKPYGVQLILNAVQGVR